ncbi:MAG: glycosyltransferase [Cyclobacteriaceae bacterium]
MKTYRILVAPLDWGLGHATRCIPVIQTLLNRGYEVHVASSGDAQRLLQLEFPQLKHFTLPSYKAKYSKMLPFMLQVFLQLPKFILAIKKENKATKEIVSDNKYDVIISDNRYGCYDSNVKSVFICHQLNIIMPKWLRWFAPVVNYFNHKWIMKFDHCWIPDDPSAPLTGSLTVPSLPNSEWIGVLSRFEKKETIKKEYQLAVVLSGPEPQRSIFEEMVLKQLGGLTLNSILVRGKLDAKAIQSVNKNLIIINYLQGAELRNVIEQSELVLCRSGYSTIMDLAKLNKKAVLVPTPGQTEQEYIGFQLMKKRVAFCQYQDEFDLELALQEIKNYSGFVGRVGHTNLLNKAIEKVLK